MSILSRFLDYMSAPVASEPTPENLALWEKRAPGWVMQCKKCGMEEPFGKYGIRLKACGTKWNFGRCPHCRKWTWLAIRKKG